MKIRVKTEDGLELSTICRQLKMQAEDGKMRETDVADTETLLRIIQSIPSPKAEPFKQWLAKVGYERMQEISDPSQGLDRARENWQKLGRSEKWIQQRMTGQETRNKRTDYWKESGVENNINVDLLITIDSAKGYPGMIVVKTNVQDNVKLNLNIYQTNYSDIGSRVFPNNGKNVINIDL